MFSVKFTLTILIILLSGFILKEVKLEFYPSVLLPSNGELITKQKNNTVIVRYNEMYTINKYGLKSKLDAFVLVKPMPQQYLPYLLENDLGLSDSLYLKSTRVRILRKCKLLEIDNSKLAQKRQSAFLWVKTKLIQQGIQCNQLIFDTYNISVSTNNGKETSRQLINEKIYNFN